MAWETTDWNKSGIKDTYRWVMCNNRTLKEEEELTGFVDGKIIGNHDGDLKYSGSITVSNSNFKTGKLLRCYYTATLESENKKTTRCLGTFFTGNDELTYLHGRYSGDIELYSTLKTQTDSMFLSPFTFKKDSSALNSWWQLAQSTGVKGYTRVNGVKDKNWGKEEIIDFGETRLKALDRIAEYLSGQVWVDAQGHIILRPYVKPSKRPVSYTVRGGNLSLVFEGVDVSIDRTDCVNRYAIKYEYSTKEKIRDGEYKSNYTGSDGVAHKKGDPKYKEKSVKHTIYGSARLDKENAYSFEKRGRFVDKVETLKNMDPKTKDRANEIAATRLSKISRGSVQYKFNSYYMPYTLGDVIHFVYKDNERASGINVDGMVTDIEMTLGLSGLRMQTTIRKVRSR